MKVSVIVPIGGRVLCRESLAAQDYKDYEIIEVTGGTFAENVNRGIDLSTGEYVMIVGAHSVYPKDYISRIMSIFDTQDVSNVGGCAVATSNENRMSQAIAECLSSFWGNGGAKFRSTNQGTDQVDTVFGGCYPRKVLEKYGRFDESLKKSSDYEYNQRIIKDSGTIILIRDLKVEYKSDDTLSAFFTHCLKDGYWTVFPDVSFNVRHYVPLVFIITLPISLPFYILATLIASKLNPYLFTAYLARHFGFGIGSVWGLINKTINQIKGETNGYQYGSSDPPTG